MKLVHLIVAFLVGLSLSPNLFANKIEQGYDALVQYDYFKAKRIFEKSIRKDSAPAAFGLATIYLRKDNPFHQLDSAYKFIQIAERNYTTVKDKWKTRLLVFQFNYEEILKLRALISKEFYYLAFKRNTIQEWDLFLVKHPWSIDVPHATFKRDSLAYDSSKRKNDSASFAKFLETYPSSFFASQAKADFYRSQFHELTAENTVAAYINFLKLFPENPYKMQAEDRIFEMETEDNTVASFDEFIRKYPNNRNIGRAWKSLYQQYMMDFTESRVDEFIKEFPAYPYQEELVEELRMNRLKLLPFKENGRFGFMDYSGNCMIEPTYEQLGFFKEGLALAVKDGMIGFIDKKNQIVIPFNYEEASDFEFGRAVVKRNDSLGIIDRTGAVVFPLYYKELGVFSEGYIEGKKDSLFGYFDKNGNQRINAQFEEAFSFTNGMAKVTLNGMHAVIDPIGSYIVPPSAEFERFYNDTMLVFKSADKYGIKNKRGKIIVQAELDEIGSIVFNRAMIVKNGMIGYLDQFGNEVIKPQFELFPNFQERGDFNSPLAVARFKGKFGLIDLNGKWIIQPMYKDIGQPASLMAVLKGKTWGFVDLTGKIVVQPSFNFAESFKDGHAIVERNGFLGLIDAKGNETIPIIYSSIDRISKDLFIVGDGAKYGIFSSEGQVVVPLKYSRIDQSEEDFLLLTTESDLEYLYLPERKLIRPNWKND